jgi:predicted nucleotide-binding protein (sugar kinase/HSP70/actin superfamily)
MGTQIMTQKTALGADKRLPIFDPTRLAANGGGELNIDAELAAFEQEQAAALGLGAETKHWFDAVPSTFTFQQRATTTLLVSGLTYAHDYFVKAALSGIGYKVETLDAPDNDALRFGKEYGNRGQCNPTYFTVGNLVKSLSDLCADRGLTKQQVVEQYVFLTAGACGPCRFGMYATEYRKALRDSGFDGFRVLLFQQQGGLKQATGDRQGLELNQQFFLSIAKALIAGDVLNALGYRIRPYEVVAGSTDAALTRSKTIIHDALESRTSLLMALWKARKELAKVEVDRTLPKPRVSIIGEFWAMTTEGDGNYRLQRFLESEGAEVDIQLVTAWILFMIWEQRWDTKKRSELREVDEARKGLKGVNVPAKLAKLWVAEKVVRATFQTFANLIGLHGYHLPDMDLIADLSKEHYNNHLRGGEAHMEVGKLILTAKKKKANLVISVKPFGCMPSSGVSDGVQTIITERFPDVPFLAIETSGDGAVNVQSRVQMMLFKARQNARAEVDAALEACGLTLEQVKAQVAKRSGLAKALFYPKHVVGSTAANVIFAVAKRAGRKVKLAPEALRQAAASELASVDASAPETLANAEAEGMAEALAAAQAARAALSAQQSVSTSGVALSA